LGVKPFASVVSAEKMPAPRIRTSREAKRNV
jgi:hypothetical protein